ncbi:hypothetical protein FA10DRAFT_266931 [Acaromyces ingoldii]|uniref:GLTSCR protein conserved domain-containing protein n=1 Tax=Acaromyces ingoldii TaxID=215250 RepID=A0A316YRQ3_9BASI|nr:hypothetical protein FA10DRAFT_266931 [Acaromyces ingoldii]PWN90455.1 hypothetical protein FA10DRAFT_266931 [Acaromyces ingoldii]
MPATHPPEHDGPSSLRPVGAIPASNDGANGVPLTSHAYQNGQGPATPNKMAVSSKMPPSAEAQPNKGKAPASSDASPNSSSRSSTLDPSLAPFAQSSKAAFAKALSEDQRAALQPDYQTAFTSVNDVVKRLLPYHVFQISEADLRYAMRDTAEEEEVPVKDEVDVAVTDRGEGSSKGTTALERNRKRTRSEVMEDDEQALLRYPSPSTTKRLWERYVGIKERASKLQQRLVGDVAKDDVGPAPFAEEMVVHILRLALQHDREEGAAASERLRLAKEEAIAAGFQWEDLVRVGAIERGTHPFLPGSSSSSSTPTSTPQGSGTSYQSPYARPGYPSNPLTPQGVPFASPYTPTPPPMKISKPRGRPRKDRSGQSMVMPSPRNVVPPFSSSPGYASSNRPMSFLQNRPPAQRPSFTPTTTRPATTSTTSSTPGNNSSANLSTTPASPRPTTTPVPLVLPLSTLSRLSELGIAPVPAPHLLPAITAQQAYAAAVASGKRPPAPPVGGNSTAPRAAPVNQSEPALLMGITEAPLSAAQKASLPAGSTSTVQQMLHVSVVLNKLNPRQLSGLAALMQSLQQQSPNPSSAAGSPPTSSPTRPAAAASPASTTAAAAAAANAVAAASSSSLPSRPPSSTNPNIKP